MLVRQSRPSDDLAPLLYAASPGLYDLYFGGRRRALAALARLARRAGHTASPEVCLVAEAEQVVGLLAGFPQGEYERRTRRFHVLALARMPPWRWRGPWRVARIEAPIEHAAPAGSWYVDSLAVASSHRRRGIGRALMAEAERRARQAGCDSVALDTAENNRAGRALYESLGMRVHRRGAVPPRARAEGSPVTGWVAYVKAL